MGEILRGDDPNDEQPPSEENRIETNEPSPASLDLQARLDTDEGEINSEILEQSFINKEITAQEYIELLQVYVKKVELRAEMVVIDELTGLANRKGFNEDLDRTINSIRSTAEKKRRDEIESIMVIALDMNDLKFLNDTHGHKIGDVALIALAERLKQCGLRPNDVIARPAGDEFLITLKLESAEDGIHEKIFGRIQSMISDLSIQITDRETGKTFTHEIHTAAGYSILTKNDTTKTIKDLLEEADDAMYADKAEMKQQKN